jgi:hypothetical protein
MGWAWSPLLVRGHGRMIAGLVAVRMIMMLAPS